MWTAHSANSHTKIRVIYSGPVLSYVFSGKMSIYFPKTLLMVLLGFHLLFGFFSYATNKMDQYHTMKFILLLSKYFWSNLFQSLQRVQTMS